jgi:hypothetical protein
VVLLLCFERYLHEIILFAVLVVSALIPPATAASTLTEIPQRAVAPFVPSALVSSRVLTEDSQWHGALQVNGMVTVAPQATLTVMPGTVVRFSPDSGLLVLGRVVVKGTKEQPVLFSSYYQHVAPADWYGIVLTGTAKKNIFDQLQIEGAETALYARSSSVELKQVRIENSLSGILLTDSVIKAQDIVMKGCSSGLSALQSEVELATVMIERSETAVSVTASSLTATSLKILSSFKTALHADSSQLKIEKSLFSANLSGAVVTTCQGSITNSKFIATTETALFLQGSPIRFSRNLVSGSKIGVHLQDNMSSVWGNSIYANSGYGILYSGDDPIYLGGNWLGTTNHELVNKSLFSKKPGAIKFLPLLITDPVSEPLKYL